MPGAITFGSARLGFDLPLGAVVTGGAVVVVGAVVVPAGTLPVVPSCAPAAGAPASTNAAASPATPQTARDAAIALGLTAPV
jgi:hypothetical protein